MFIKGVIAAMIMYSLDVYGYVDFAYSVCRRCVWLIFSMVYINLVTHLWCIKGVPLAPMMFFCGRGI